MFGLRALFALSAGLLAFAAPAVAQTAASAPDRNATAVATITRPASVRKLEDLNFAYVSVTAAGTATVDPNTDLMTTTGGVLHAGGVPYAALFSAISPVKNVVIIRIPRNPITITRQGGTETMRVDNWTLSGSPRRTVPTQEPFEFKIGGTLHVNANQAEGTYVGTFTVEVQYP